MQSDMPSSETAVHAEGNHTTFAESHSFINCIMFVMWIYRRFTVQTSCIGGLCSEHAPVATSCHPAP